MDHPWLEMYRMWSAACEMHAQAEHALEHCERVRIHLRQQRDRLQRLDGVKHEVDIAIMLDAFLNNAVSRTGADMANVQIRDPVSGALHIAAANGFSRPFLDFFARVADVRSAC